jgi:ubiquinone/menaquinone biosynthesis C-methylase UbiE
MSELEDVYRVEQAKWDEIAKRKLPQLRVSRYVDFHDYAHKVSTMIGISEFLGDLHGKSVLELGCGLGELSCLLAQSGAHVTAFDISPISVYVAQKRAEMHSVTDHTRFCVAAGERLPFPDESFDVIFAKGVLHHLQAETSQPELNRVLKAGGKAAFAEPLGMNPLLVFSRAYLPYPNKNPRGADRPLSYRDIHNWSKGFTRVSVREIQLLSMLERGFGQNTRLPALRRADSILLKYIPPLRRFCRYVILFFEKA